VGETVIRDRDLIEYAEGIVSSGVSGPIGWTDIHRLVRRLLVALKEEMKRLVKSVKLREKTKGEES
jgi:hypothetical protein